MKFESIQLRNFLSFGQESRTIVLSDFNILVGPNSSGKTNVLRAISFLAKSLTDTFPNPSYEYYHSGRSEFDVGVHLNLSKEEANALADYLVVEPLSEAINLIKGEESQPLAQQIAFEIATKLRQRFVEAFAKIELGIFARGQESGGPELYIGFGTDGATFYMDRYGNIRSTKERRSSGQQIQFGRFLIDSEKNADPSSNFEDQFFPMLNSYLKEKDNVAVAQQWLDLNNIEQRKGAGSSIRSLRAFVRSRGHNDRQVTFLNLVKLIYERSIVAVSELRSRAQAFVSLPESNEMARGPLGDTGKNLNVTLFNLKNSSNIAERDRYIQSSQLIESF